MVTKRTKYLHPCNTIEVFCSTYITEILKLAFYVDEYTPLHAEQSDESLWTHSNGGDCLPTFHLDSVMILNATVLVFVSTTSLTLELFCLVCLTICSSNGLGLFGIQDMDK